MKVERIHAGESVSLEVRPDGNGWSVTLPEGAQSIIQVSRTGDNGLAICDVATGRAFEAWAAETSRGLEISLGGRSYVFEKPRPQARRSGKASNSGELCAPMVGVVTGILVSEGDTVSAHQAVATVEAMKVVATLEAPFDGTVKKVLAKQGDKVGHGQVVIIIEAST